MPGIKTQTWSMNVASTANMLPATGSLYTYTSTVAFESGSSTSIVLVRIAFVIFIGYLYPARPGPVETQRVRCRSC
jgi:hypothetical protein